jgi:phosphoribosylamine--glycine ligase
VVLPLLKTDLLTVMQAVAEGRLREIEVEFENKHACCVIVASSGYPGKYESGNEITVSEDFGGQVYFAGAKLQENKLVNAGGRVAGVTCIGDTLQEAIDKAYAEVKIVTFSNAYYRKDIGQRALSAAKEV